MRKFCGLRFCRQRHADQRGLSFVSKHRSNSACMIVDKAKEHYAKVWSRWLAHHLRTADGAFPGAVDAAQLFQQIRTRRGIPLEIKREPNDGYWSKSGTSSRSAHPTGAVVRFRIRCTRQRIFQAQIGTTQSSITRSLTPNCLLQRQSCDGRSAKQLYSEMGQMVRERGRSYLPNVQRLHRRCQRQACGLGSRSKRRADERSGHTQAVLRIRSG